MDYFPLFHDLRGRRCLLVGGGVVALRKARLLLSAGADLQVVAPDIQPELAALVQAANGVCRFEPFAESHLEGAVLVVAATNQTEVNRTVSELCQARCVPVNVVDSPALCTVITPAIVDRSPLIIGITSGGEAPVLARVVRTQLESLFPAAWGRAGALASRFRAQVKAAFADGEARRRFWEAVFAGPIFERVLAGDEAGAETLLSAAIERGRAPEGGEVYLVGAGPGDPDLLTFKALRLMQKAEVVLYDRLVAEPILNMTRRDAERIYVGKQRSQHALAQTDINQLLVDLALAGKRVLRLKGGDPFIFGRGGEELELLAAHGVPFQVVPGITAASGCASYAGIPLTHRDCAQSVRFVTGHRQNGSFELPADVVSAVRETLVVYMGLTGLDAICDQLIRAGRAPSTPAALIERGTLPEQKVHVSDLAQLPALVASQAIHAPTLLIIGEVVGLRAKLGGFAAAIAGQGGQG